MKSVHDVDGDGETVTFLKWKNKQNPTKPADWTTGVKVTTIYVINQFFNTALVLPFTFQRRARVLL